MASTGPIRSSRDTASRISDAAVFTFGYRAWRFTQALGRLS
jgi:hypothetical protein